MRTKHNRLFMKFFFIFFGLFFFSPLQSQSKHVSGQWDGFMVLNQQKYPIEMNIHVKGKGKIAGFTSVGLPDGNVIEMKIKGQLHYDRSVTVREIKIVNKEELQEIEWYRKNFQLVFKRDLWEMTMEGYWQEQIPQILDENSKKGKIYLKKRAVKA